jgi:hypothetical protein
LCRIGSPIEFNTPCIRQPFLGSFLCSHIAGPTYPTQHTFTFAWLAKDACLLFFWFAGSAGGVEQAELVPAMPPHLSHMYIVTPSEGRKVGPGCCFCCYCCCCCCMMRHQFLVCVAAMYKRCGMPGAGGSLLDLGSILRRGAPYMKRRPGSSQSSLLRLFVR